MVEETRDPVPEDGRRQPEYLTVTSGLPPIRTVGMDAPWRWLREGWRDFRAATGTSLFYGVALTAMGVLLTQTWGKGAIEIAFFTGFLLVGPFLAMGLYDVRAARHSSSACSSRPMRSPSSARTSRPAAGSHCSCSRPRWCRCRCCSTARRWTRSQR
jgi:uncharacterized membrane protein